MPAGEGVRVDGAFEEGMEIPIYYDPMIAKLVVWGKDREEAIRKCIVAIDDFEISGLKTTLDFGKYVLTHPAFCSGDFDTNFVKSYFSDSQAIFDGFTEETTVLQSGINQLWDDLKSSKQKQFASHPIITNWVKVP